MASPMEGRTNNRPLVVDVCCLGGLGRVAEGSRVGQRIVQVGLAEEIKAPG